MRKQGPEHVVLIEVNIWLDLSIQLAQHRHRCRIGGATVMVTPDPFIAGPEHELLHSPPP